MNPLKKHYVLAWDVEKVGRLQRHDLAGMGASVLEAYHDTDGTQVIHEVDFRFWPMLRRDTVFGESCWESFWKDKPQLRQDLLYTGKLRKEAREKEVLREFHSLRTKWELHAAAQKTTLQVVSDAMMFDGVELARLYAKYLPNIRPPLYTACRQEYCGDIWDTDSMLRGYLIASGVHQSSPWGMTSTFRRLINAPTPERVHSHLPHEDAYSIAFDAQLLNLMNDSILLLRQKQQQQAVLRAEEEEAKEELADASTTTVSPEPKERKNKEQETFEPMVEEEEPTADAIAAADAMLNIR